MGQGTLVAAVVPHGWQSGDERGNERARRAEHGVLGQVEPQRVGGRGSDRRDAQQVGGRGVFRQCLDGAAGYGDGVGGRGERGARAHPAGPQPLGDLLVGVPCGQVDRVDTAEVVAVTLDECDAGPYGQLAAGSGAARALPLVAPGQRLDLPGVEGAAPAAGNPAAAELTAAHIRVDGLRLHAEQLGGLLGAQSPVRVAGDGFLIAHGGHRIRLAAH